MARLDPQSSFRPPARSLRGRGLRSQAVGRTLALALWSVAGSGAAWEPVPTDPGWYGAGQAPPPRGDRWLPPANEASPWRDEAVRATPWRFAPAHENAEPWHAPPEREWREGALAWPPVDEELRGYRFREDRRFERFDPALVPPDYRFRPLSSAERRRHAEAFDPRWRPEREPRPPVFDEGPVPPPRAPFLPFPGYEGMGFYPAF